MGEAVNNLNQNPYVLRASLRRHRLRRQAARRRGVLIFAVVAYVAGVMLAMQALSQPLRSPAPTPRPTCTMIDGRRVCDIRHLPSDGRAAPTLTAPLPSPRPARQ